MGGVFGILNGGHNENLIKIGENRLKSLSGIKDTIQEVDYLQEKQDGSSLVQFRTTQCFDCNNEFAVLLCKKKSIYWDVVCPSFCPCCGNKINCEVC